MAKGDKIFMENRHEFTQIKSFDEFNKFYWYREELPQNYNNIH